MTYSINLMFSKDIRLIEKYIRTIKDEGTVD